MAESRGARFELEDSALGQVLCRLERKEESNDGSGFPAPLKS